MYTKKSWLFGIGCVVLMVLATQSASAQEWEQLLETQVKRSGDTEGTGNVWGRTVTKLGREMIEFKVEVKTKVRGRGKTGRAFATFAVVGADSKPILTLQAAKYASTGIDTSKEKTETQTISVGADAFWEKWDADMAKFCLNVECKEKIDFPTTAKDAEKWYKDNIAPELAKALDTLKGKGVGEVVSGDGWIMKNVKKGSLK